MTRYSRQHSNSIAINWLYAVAETLHRFVARGCSIVLTHVDGALSRVAWSVRFSVTCAALGGSLLLLVHAGLPLYAEYAALTTPQLDLLRNSTLGTAFERWSVLAKTLGAILCVLSACAFLRRRFILTFLRIAGAATCVIVAYLIWFMFRAPALLYAANAEAFARDARNSLWLLGYGTWVPLAATSVILLVASTTRLARQFYLRSADTAKDDASTWGDRIVHNIRTHGRDPNFRRALYWAGALHVAIVVAGPLLSQGCSESPYGIQKGRGQEQVAVVQVTRIENSQKQRILFNLQSPILFHKPTPTDDVIKHLDRETAKYKETTASETGKLGDGGGTQGGWPNGIENAEVRFIRLEYGGGDWDQDMGVGADYNLLLKIRDWAGLQIAGKTEHRPIRQLRRFPSGQSPPFVFITGGGTIAVNSTDINTLRWYCIEEGGMIFADNGGGGFDASFRALINRLFPERSWVDIANDDPIFQQPYRFINGAPPLWHHSGHRAMGIKADGRWIVFYHQGDLNDAWKDGHSGISPQLANDAYRMGINVVSYAFRHYMHLHHTQ